MYEISEVIFTAIEGFLCFILFAIMSNRKELPLKRYLIRITVFILIYTFYTYWITAFVPTGIHAIFVISLTIVVLNYVFVGTIFKSTIKVLLIFIGLSIIEAVIAALGMFIVKAPLDTLIDNDFYAFILSLIAKIIEIITVIVIAKLNINISWLSTSNSNQFKYKYILTIIAAFMFVSILINVSIINTSQNLVAYGIFSFLVYLILITFLFYAFREGSKLEMIQYANEMRKENIKQLMDFNEMVAKERHEYKNHLNTIYGLCTLNKPDLSDKIKNYINNFANNSLTQNFSISSGSDFVDAIINVKYNNALRKGIEVSVNFDEPLSSAKFNEDMAVTIISNILENAFESIVNATEVPDKKMYVKLETYIQNNLYYIAISNNGPKIPEHIMKKLFTAGFSTKNNPSNTRGFGLSIVQNELEKCGGRIFINSTEDVTEFLLVLQINSEIEVVG